MKIKEDKSLSLNNKLSCYLIPFEVVFTGINWTFHSRLKRKNQLLINEFKEYGETNKIEEVKLVQKRAYRFFIFFWLLIFISGFLIIIFTAE
tara:strand:- start:126 stop:401 length:276 start_codon:yes stop_codon:yes gene_type:complete